MHTYSYSVGPVDGDPVSFVVNISRAARQNRSFCTNLWTGEYLHLTLMSIPVGGEIGLGVHPSLDQFMRIEEGNGYVTMGPRKDALPCRRNVCESHGVFIPAGIWYNLVNTGHKPIKLYAVYAPSQQYGPSGTDL